MTGNVFDCIGELLKNESLDKILPITFSKAADIIQSSKKTLYNSKKDANANFSR